MSIEDPENNSKGTTGLEIITKFHAAQLHLQKLPKGVVTVEYRNPYIFGFPAEIRGSCGKI